MTGLSYDRIGRTYSATRRADPRLATAIWAGLGDARTVLNLGAGTGSYEPPKCDVTAVEPSAVMIAQRPAAAPRAIRARAEELPFEDDTFDAAMAVLSDHHWSDRPRGFEELGHISVFAQLATREIAAGIEALRVDLGSGIWHDRHRDLLGRSELHLGYYVAIAELRPGEAR